MTSAWTPDSVARVETALRSRGGTATRAQLESDGVTRAAIRHAVAAGTMRRLVRGRYALASAPQALQAAVLLGGVLSHRTAAAHWMLESTVSPAMVDVTVRRAARRRVPAGVVLHWQDLDPDDVDHRVTGVERTVLDCARLLPFPDALAVADSALRRRACEASDLIGRAGLLKGPGSAAARRVVAAADPRADNPLESVLRAVVIEAGVTGFEPQLQIDEGGRRSRVDLGDLRRRLVLEADSFTFHGTRQALDRDCRRYSDLVAAGWSVLRFSWEQVMFDRSWVADCVTDLVAQSRTDRTDRTDGTDRTGRAARDCTTGMQPPLRR